MTMTLAANSMVIFLTWCVKFLLVAMSASCGFDTVMFHGSIRVVL